MPSTYTPLGTTTLTSATNVVNFSSIPSTYTDLIAVLSVRQTSSATYDVGWVRANNDGSSIYSSTELFGNGATAQSFRNTGQSLAYIGQTPSNNSTSGVFGNIIVNIPNYANTTTYKTFLSRSNNADTDGRAQATVALWRSTSAISILSFWTNGANWAVGSTFTLYGVKSA